MMNLSEWERENFYNSTRQPGLTVIFPSREIYFSPELLYAMRLEDDTCPKTLDQWYELCHPEDHSQISMFERALESNEIFFSQTRKLYCGDGHYRAFRLDAFIQRSPDGKAVKLFGNETLALNAWLELANEGDRIYCGTKTLEAVRIQGAMTLFDVSAYEDMQQENLRLRREIQRRIFAPSPSIVKFSHSDSEGRESFIRTELEDNINAALNVLTGNNQLTALRRSLSESCLTIGVAGLTSSGKSTFMNALLGERLIPEQTKATTNIPIMCREGESRGAKIFYRDGRIENVSGGKLTAGYVKNIASESFNPSNRAGIARVEITMPGALIPEGLCFVDTPGFDALASSGGAALRNILPELDIILYITPVRSRLKSADYEFLKVILNVNDRIIFVVSQIDLERDDSEAGKIINSAHDKILGDIKSIRHDMKKFAGHDFDVIPVSAKIALEKFYDKKSSGWSESNIEGVISYLAPLSDAAFTRALLSRAERALRIINSVIEREATNTNLNWKLQDIAGNLRKILSGRVNLPEVSRSNLFTDDKLTVRTRTSLLDSLLSSIREYEFRTKFFAQPAINKSRKIILLGSDRTQSMKLFARLAHNLALENLPDGGVSSSEWLHSGHVSPFGCIKLPLIGSEYNILIAPSNLNIKNNPDWHKLFREYVPVVSVDLARVDSGLSDLAYSPYVTGLALSRWVLAFGNAALFDTRQIDLVSQVPERVKEFTELNGLKSPDWFIFENYKIFQQ